MKTSEGWFVIAWHIHFCRYLVILSVIIIKAECYRSECLIRQRFTWTCCYLFIPAAISSPTEEPGVVLIIIQNTTWFVDIIPTISNTCLLLMSITASIFVIRIPHIYQNKTRQAGLYEKVKISISKMFSLSPFFSCSPYVFCLFC